MSNKTKVEEILARIREKKAEQEKLIREQQEQAQRDKEAGSSNSYVPSSGKQAELVEQMLEKATGVTVVKYNDKQQEAINWIANFRNREQKELVFIGAAGTGKTTAIRGAIELLLADISYPKFETSTKYLRYGDPGVVMVSYTNKAVAQIRRNVPEAMKHQCLTIHRLLEYEPVFYEVWDEELQGFRNTMRFEPMRNKNNKLPYGLHTLIIDESSMVDEQLFAKLLDALHDTVRIVYIGDLNQLPPVFGDSILGRKMLTAPIVELTDIYRQAAESPIIKFAWQILEGKWNLFSSRTDVDENGNFYVPAYRRLTTASNKQIKLIPWPKKVNAKMALFSAANRYMKLSDTGGYIPEEDMILIPYNVQFGTIEFNKKMAQHLGVKRQAVVHEVISGINKHYYAEGDKVLFMKEEYIIDEIVRNGNYSGHLLAIRLSIWIGGELIASGMRKHQQKNWTI